MRVRFNTWLWVVQGLLAGLFLFAGGAKLAMPLDALKGPVTLPGGFLRFIGLMEVLGAAGLILPQALRVLPGLTPVAALGLTIIMAGAATLTLASIGVVPALLPLVVGVLTASVARGRWDLCTPGRAEGARIRRFEERAVVRRLL